MSEARAHRRLQPELPRLEQVIGDFVPRPFQKAPLAREKEQIVDVADVAFHLQLPLHEVVESLEIEVGGEELTGERADGETRSLGWPVGIEPGVPPHSRRGIQIGARVEDPIDQLEEAPIAHAPRQQIAQDVEVDAGKVALDVEMDEVAVFPNERQDAQDRGRFA